jgi:hypothetical protein
MVQCCGLTKLLSVNVIYLPIQISKFTCLAVVLFFEKHLVKR